MCGIAGVFHLGGRLPDERTLEQCVNRLRRRGPDDSGLWSDANVRLAHRRLAVVDLSPTGHQPMVTADGRYVIVFNGEIYNHADLRPQLAPPGGWRGTSDTETLVEAYRAWGVNCLQRINGMFAFAIWDRHEKCLFVARDRLGVKPLYYSWRHGVFGFASRPGAVTPLLDAASADVDFDALRAYLELGYIPAPYSFYRHVRKLKAGHYMTVDARGLNIERYWDFGQIEPDAAWLRRPENDLLDELDELVRRAVRDRLMSDVPLGAFLSGGVDSAMIVAAMQASGVSEPRAFTIAFHEAAYNEGPAAAQIAKHLGVEHVMETLSVSDLLGLMPLYVEEFDEPFADSSAFPTMAVARLARRDVTVALSGEGGDELFGGYHYYQLAERFGRINRWPQSAKSILRSAIIKLPSHRAKLFAGALRPTTPIGVFGYLRSLTKDFDTLLNDAVLANTQPSLAAFEDAARGFAPSLTSAELGMRLDLRMTLGNGYLQKVDVATMASSLEARNPFVDYRLVEWAMRLPTSFKIRGGETKYLLKKLLSRYVPAPLVYRPKRGFGVPAAQWLRGPLRNWAYELLHDESVISRLPLDRKRVRALFDLHMSGARDAHPLFWAVLMLLCFVAKHDRGFELPLLTRRAA